jgi:hypothetical protein
MMMESYSCLAVHCTRMGTGFVLKDEKYRIAEKEGLIWKQKAELP